MANSNDFFNTDTANAYGGEYEDEFSHDAEEDSYGSGSSKSKFSMPKLPKGGSFLSGNTILVIGIVVCLLLNVICIASVNRAKDSLAASFDMLKAELQTVKQANSEILAHLAAVEAELDTTQSAISGKESSKYIQITKQPSSTPTTIGRDGALIFQLTANGNNLKMTWQKYDSVSGEWINVPFDIDGYETEMGLRLYDDSSNGTSELWARNLTAKAFGTYRCVITDNVGSQVISEVVEISEKTSD